MLKFMIRFPFVSYILIASSIWKLAPLFGNFDDVWDGKACNWLQKLFYGGIAQFAKEWNEYEVHDLDRIVKIRKNCLLVGYHSRCTLDLMYLLCTIRCHLLVTHLLFYIPILGSLLHLLGILPSKGGVREGAEKSFIDALSQGDRPLMLLPGGAFECLKNFHDRYRVMWKEEPGFARVIAKEPTLRSNTKVVPFYTKNCEQCFWSTAWWYTSSGRGVKFLMEQFSQGQVAVLPLLMVLLLCALGFFPLPVPCKLDTYFGEELVIEENETPAQFALRVKTSLHELIDKVNGLPPKPFTRSRPFYSTFLGIFTLMQNLLVHSIGITLLLGVLYPLLLLTHLVGLDRLFSKPKSH